jgi:hypothetical protein
MAKALLDADKSTGRLTIYHEMGDGKNLIETRQDVTHIVEAAKILSEETPGKDFRLAAVATEFGVSQGTIWNIRTGRTWRHVS